MDHSLIESIKRQFESKKVLVVGLGIQGGGLGTAKFFSELGAKVTVTDLRTSSQLSSSLSGLNSYQINYTLGEHKLADFMNADYIFKGPSVPWILPELLEAQKKGILIEMEASFFADFCPALIIGVTGTRGKTTTSHMIYESLKHTVGQVYLAGNVSDTSTIELLHKVGKGDVVVLELSSWQLSGFHKKKISPHISVFTNFFPDHLNYYKNQEEYFYDKRAIFQYQKKGDYLIANKYLKKEIEKHSPKAVIRYFSLEDFPRPLTRLHGEHNRENAAAALLVNEVLGNNLKMAVKIISDFAGVAYREQIVKEKSGVIFVNDTTSTTPTSTIKALEAFKVGKIVLILGGNSKKLPYDELINKLRVVDYIVLIAGTFTDEIFKALLKKYPDKISEPYKKLNIAVQRAYEVAKTFNQKTYVVFSPGATSFAMFNNEFDRGRQFNEVINSL